MPRTLLFDRSDRMRLQVSGPQNVATLNGLVTNDIAALVPGTGVYAAALTSKGKMVADLRIFRVGDTLLLDTSARAAGGLREMIAKYINPRFATVADVTEALCDLGVFGELAAQVIATAVGGVSQTFVALAPYAQQTVAFDGVTVVVARVPDLGVDGYELFVPRTHRDRLYHAVRTAGATQADAEQWQTLRVAIGWPEWGVDMDETTLPQEANFDELNGVSYTKGCYIGQETVARIHFRGHVNRTLRRVAFEEVPDGEWMPEPGTKLVDANDAVVGDVRSTARLPGGRVFGIGMVRQAIHHGTTLTAHWGGDTAPARTAQLRVLGPANGSAIENAKGAIE